MFYFYHHSQFALNNFLCKPFPHLNVLNLYFVIHLWLSLLTQEDMGSNADSDNFYWTFIYFRWRVRELAIYWHWISLRHVSVCGQNLLKPLLVIVCTYSLSSGGRATTVAADGQSTEKSKVADNETSQIQPTTSATSLGSTTFISSHMSAASIASSTESSTGSKNL